MSVVTTTPSISRKDPTARVRRAASPWKIWLPIPLLFLLLNATFDLWFWKIPKLTSSSDDYGYGFLINVQRLHQPKPPGGLRVLAFGSSVTSIFDPQQVQTLIDADRPPAPIEVERLFSPGMKPADYRLFFHAERDRIRPDVVVAAFNFVDFRNPSFERDVKENMRYLLPPWQALRERGPYMSFTSKLDLVLAGISPLYRYRALVRSCLEDHVQFAWQWLHASAVREPYGIYADGYTQQNFGVRLERGAAVLEYYIEPEWIRQRGTVRLTFSAAGGRVTERVETEPGWKSVRIVPGNGGDAWARVAADSAWVPRANGTNNDVRLLGVRLREVPPAELLNGNRPPLRYPPWEPSEIKPFLRMGDGVGERFAAAWQPTFAADTDFARRFARYREGRLEARDTTFEPAGEFAEMERMVRDFSEHGVRVVLVNTPESPWMLAEYESGPYYQGYLRFFQDLAAKYPGVEFYDLRHRLPPEDFNDWHHVTYIGGIKLGPFFAKAVRAAAGVDHASARRH